MLTFLQIQALTIGESVLYTPEGYGPITCTVVRNGAPLDANNQPLPDYPPILTLQQGDGPTTIAWGYVGLSDGLPELALPS